LASLIHPFMTVKNKYMKSLWFIGGLVVAFAIIIGGTAALASNGNPTGKGQGNGITTQDTAVKATCGCTGEKKAMGGCDGKTCGGACNGTGQGNGLGNGQGCSGGCKAIK
jgi:hypothetical protein